MKLSTAPLTALLATLALSAHLHAQDVNPPPGAAAAILDQLRVAKYSLQRIETTLRPDGSLEAFVRLSDGEAALVLDPHSIRAQEFDLLVQNHQGKLRSVEAPEPQTYRGTAYRMSGAAESEVAASYVDGSLMAFIRSTDDSIEVVQPLADAVPGADPSLAVVFDARDALADSTHCGLDTTPDGHHTDTEPEQGRTAASTSLSLCQIAIDADRELYQLNGSSVAATVADVETVLNAVSMIYERDVAVTYEITRFIVRTAEPDPYTSTDPTGLLNQFRNEWNGAQSGVHRDVAHLMTGKDIDGNVVGYGAIGVVCEQDRAYALSQTRYTTNLQRRVALTSHELGHNWDSRHCDGDGDCAIMCSMLGGCSGNLTGLGARSRNSIVRHRNGVSCLSAGSTTLDLPFADDFKKKTIRGNRWASSRGTKASKKAKNEPSDKRSANLDAKRDGRQDELVSHWIDLAGASSVKVRFYTEHRGVEAGEQLLVEYTLADGTWVTLTTVISDGVDQETFQFRQVTLPGAAYHGRFQIRFRPLVDERDDEWYLDDVYVGV